MHTNNRSQPEPLAYRIDDAASVLGLSRSKLYQLIKAGELRKERIAGRTLILRRELEALLQRHTEPREEDQA